MSENSYQGVASAAELAENERLMAELRAGLGLPTPAPAGGASEPQSGDA